MRKTKKIIKNTLKALKDLHSDLEKYDHKTIENILDQTEELHACLEELIEFEQKLEEVTKNKIKERQMLWSE